MKRLAIMLFVAGCASEEKKPMASSVRVEIVSVTPSEPEEGETIAVRYRIVNDSNDVLVLGRGQSQYGHLRRESDEKVVHNILAQQATSPVFYSSSQLLPPGKSREELVQVEALESEVKVRPMVSRCGASAIAIFVSRSPSGESADHEFVKVPLTEVTGELAPREIIVFDAGKSEDLSASRALKLRPRSFPLTEARRLFGEAASLIRWSASLGGWLMESAQRTAVVKPDGPLDFPSGAACVLGDYEREAKTFAFRLADPAKTELARMFRTREGDGMYTQGTFVDVPRERLFEALKLAREEKLSVGQVFYFFSSYYFELKPAK